MENNTIRMSAEIGELATALAKAQGEFTEVKKTGKGNMNSKDYRYALLDDILTMVRPILAKHGLSFMQPLASSPNGVGIVCLLTHSSGQWLMGPLFELRIEEGYIKGAQAAGSAITYSRRYSASPFLGIATEEDDDGAGASKDKPAPQKAPQDSNQTPTGTPKMMSEAQSKKMHVCFNELEITDKAERMAYVNEVLRIMGASPVESSSSLTSKQASEIIGKLIDDKKASDSANSAGWDNTDNPDKEPF